MSCIHLCLFFLPNSFPIPFIFLSYYYSSPVSNHGRRVCIFPCISVLSKYFGVSVHILAVAQDSLGFSHILVTQKKIVWIFSHMLATAGDSLGFLPYSGNRRRFFPHILTMIPLLLWSHCNSPYAFRMEEVMGR